MPTVRPRTTIYLWEFLLQLLDGEENCSAICWVNRERGEFVLKDQSEIAKLWGKVKGRPRMDKIKLGRAMRYYYKKKLLAKVPKRKAVYRFTKFDYLKQKESEIIRHEDFPEIDFSENAMLDMISDDQSEGEASLPAEVDGNDTPLESMLAGKNQQVFPEEKCQKLLPVEASCNSNEIIDRNCDGSVRNSFYDQNNNTTSFYGTNEDYYVPCTEMNTLSHHGRQNHPSYIKNGGFEPLNYNVPQCYYPSVDCNNSYPSCDVEAGHLASLLLNSILMSDQQMLQESINLRESYSTVPVSCVSGNITPESVVSPTFSGVKSESSVNGLTAAQFQDIEAESTLSTLKEFERLLMINRSF